MRAVIDYDFICFEAACLAEDRSIRVTHNKTGKAQSFPNRTAFYGGWQKKNGGWLAECNKDRKKPFLVDDFTIEDLQENVSMGKAVNIVDSRIESILNTLGAKDYYGYVTKGDSFRVEMSTILKYKSNRANLIRPVLLSEVKQYIVDRYHGSFQEHYECDDKVVMDYYAKEADVVIAVEKDFYGCEIKLFNPDSMIKPELIKGLGGLWLNGKREVKGKGRIWLLHQVLSGDASDYYFANSATDKRWGEKASYQLLNGCKTDKEAFQALMNGYKELYPEKKIVKGWRGNDIEIDALYMANENFQMARMRRFEGDEFHLSTVLDKLGITY